MITGRRFCEKHRIIFHVILIIIFTKHRIWILLRLFCFFSLFFIFLCFFFEIELSSFFCLFFNLPFSSLLLVSLSFFIISRVACLGPVQDEMSFHSLFYFSCGVSCAFVCVCFSYSVIILSAWAHLSSICVALLQVPGFYCTCISFCSVKLFVLFRASGNEMFGSHLIFYICFSCSHCGHCLEFEG